MENYIEISYASAGVLIAWAVHLIKKSGWLKGYWLLVSALVLSEIFSITFEAYRDGALTWGSLYRGVYAGVALTFTTAKAVDLLKEGAENIELKQSIEEEGHE